MDESQTLADVEIQFLSDIILGDEFTCRIIVNPKKDFMAEYVQVKLECIEDITFYSRYKGHGSLSKREKVIHAQQKKEAVSHMFSLGFPVELETSFSLPPLAAPSIRRNVHSIVWKVSAVISDSNGNTETYEQALSLLPFYMNQGDSLEESELIVLHRELMPVLNFGRLMKKYHIEFNWDAGCYNIFNNIHKGVCLGNNLKGRVFITPISDINARGIWLELFCIIRSSRNSEVYSAVKEQLFEGKLLKGGKIVLDINQKVPYYVPISYKGESFSIKWYN